MASGRKDKRWLKSVQDPDLVSFFEDSQFDAGEYAKGFFEQREASHAAKRWVDRRRRSRAELLCLLSLSESVARRSAHASAMERCGGLLFDPTRGFAQQNTHRVRVRRCLLCPYKAGCEGTHTQQQQQQREREVKELFRDLMRRKM